MRSSDDVVRRLPIRVGHHHMDVARALVRAHRRANEPFARFSAWLGTDTAW